MGKGSKSFQTFIGSIPDSKLSGFTDSEYTLYKDLNFKTEPARGMYAVGPPFFFFFLPYHSALGNDFHWFESHWANIFVFIANHRWTPILQHPSSIQRNPNASKQGDKRYCGGRAGSHWWVMEPSEDPGCAFIGFEGVMEVQRKVKWSVYNETKKIGRLI